MPILMNAEVAYQLALLAGVAFIQNMAFTWMSRARNSGDPLYARVAALCSNGIWFFTNILILRQAMEAVTKGDYGTLLLTGVIYTVATTEGSVLAHRILLKTESGKRRVGAGG